MRAAVVSSRKEDGPASAGARRHRVSIATRILTTPTDPTVEEQPATVSAPARPTSRRGIRHAVKWYVISRLVVIAATIPAIFQHDPGAGPWPVLHGGNALLRALGRWDGAWYVWVADRGYPTAHEFTHHLSEVAFFPLYPAVVRGLSAATGLSELASAVTVATLVGVVATVVFWHLAERLAGRTVADRAVLLFVFFPGSFALSMAYAEGFMVAAAAGCLLLLLRRQWVLAGLVGALATASRPNAIAVVLACAIVAVVEVRRHRDWAALLAPVLASTGALAFFAYLWIRTGHALAWFQSEREMWKDHIGYGQGIAQRLTGLFHHLPSFRSGGLNDLVAVLGAIVVIGGLVLLWRARWPIAVRSYTAAALVVPALSVAVGPRPRMLFGAFPMAVLVAERSSRTTYRVALIASVVVLIALTVVMTTSLAATP